MRLLHVVPTYLPAVRYGGPIYSVHALCQALAGRGHEIHVYTTNIDGPGVSDVPLDHPVEIDGVQVSYFPCGLGRRLYRSPGMARALEVGVMTFDAVHVHSVFLWPTLAAARTARRAGVPYVLAPRGMLVGDLIERKGWLRKFAWIELFERGNIAEAATIHVTSNLEKAEILKLNLPARHFSVIANGVEPPDPISGCRSAATQNPYVLSLGRLNWKKGLDRLVAAMALVPSAELLIAGNDEENYQPQLEKIARDMNLSGRVRFLGPVHGAEKWQLVRSAAIFVLPSHSENFGIAVLEAMVCGCPVIVSPQVGLAEVIHAAGAGVIVDGEPDQLGSVIASLLADPARRRLMGEAGKRLALTDYSWGRIAEQMEQVYLRCRGERTQRA